MYRLIQRYSLSWWCYYYFAVLEMSLISVSVSWMYKELQVFMSDRGGATHTQSREATADRMKPCIHTKSSNAAPSRRVVRVYLYFRT